MAEISKEEGGVDDQQDQEREKGQQATEKSPSVGRLSHVVSDYAPRMQSEDQSAHDTVERKYLHIAAKL